MVLEEGAQIVEDPEAADPDEDDRPRHLQLLVGKLRPLDCAGDGRGRSRTHGRDALRADAERVIEVEVSGMVFFDEKGERLNG